MSPGKRSPRPFPDHAPPRGRPLTCRLVRLPRKAPRWGAAGRPGRVSAWVAPPSLAAVEVPLPLLPCLPPSPAAEAASIAAGEGGRPRAAEAVVSIPDSVRGCEGVWGLGPAAGTSSQVRDQGRSSHLGAGSLLKSSSNYSSPDDAPATLPKVTCPGCC